MIRPTIIVIQLIAPYFIHSIVGDDAIQIAARLKEIGS